MASVVYHGYNQVVKGGEIGLFKSYRPDCNDGEQRRDFVYVKDVVKVIQFFLAKDDVNGISM